MVSRVAVASVQLGLERNFTIKVKSICRRPEISSRLPITEKKHERKIMAFAN